MQERSTPLAERIISLAKPGLPVLVILLVGLQYWQSAPRQQEARQSQMTAARLWETQPAAFPLDVLSAGFYTSAAHSPLDAFDPGDGPWLGTTLWLQLARLTRSQDQPGYDYFPAGRQVGLSAALLLQLAIPLLAAAICWQRREHRFVLDPSEEWLFVNLRLVESLGPALALAFLVTALLQWRTLGVDGAIRMIFLLALYLFYAVAAGSICCFLYARLGNPHLSASLICFFCLFNLVLARPLTVNLAAAMFPLPSLNDLAKKIEFETRNGYNGVEPYNDRQRRFVSEALADYKVKSIAELPVNLSAILLRKEERHQREIFLRRLGELREQFQKQERLEQSLSLLFPFTAIQIASSALAATDFRSEREQLNAADYYWDLMVRKIYEDVVQSSGPEARKVPRGPEYWKQFQIYQAQLPNVWVALEACLLPCAGFVLWTLPGALNRRKEDLAA